MLIKKCQTNNKPMFYVPITLTTLYDQPSIEFIHSSQFLSNTEEMKPTLIKPVPPSNPKYNTAVQVRSQRSANRFSAFGEKAILFHSDYESYFNVPRDRPHKEEETMPSLILDPIDSYQPSKSID